MSGQGQLRLKIPRQRTHGGQRKGAGRKPKRDRAGVSHHGRDEVTRDTPVHVTLRVLDHVWNLRSRRCHAVVRAALAGMKDRRDFRVVHYSVQGNHLHLLAEADGNRELSEGLQHDPAPQGVSDVPVKLPETWLLRMGWRRRGLVAASETPAARF